MKSSSAYAAAKAAAAPPIQLARIPFVSSCGAGRTPQPWPSVRMRVYEVLLARWQWFEKCLLGEYLLVASCIISTIMRGADGVDAMA
jgi:hypothetical protein